MTSFGCSGPSCSGLYLRGECCPGIRSQRAHSWQHPGNKARRYPGSSEEAQGTSCPRTSLQKREPSLICPRMVVPAGLSPTFLQSTLRSGPKQPSPHQISTLPPEFSARIQCIPEMPSRALILSASSATCFQSVNWWWRSSSTSYCSPSTLADWKMVTQSLGVPTSFPCDALSIQA